MNIKRVKYIAYYNDNKTNNGDNRNTFLAINNKVDYICNALKSIGYDVEIVSPCWSNSEVGYYRGTVNQINEGIVLRNFFTFGSRGKILKKVKQALSSILLFKYLVFNVDDEDILIIYHSISLMHPVTIAKFIRKLNVILEVEEIYSDVWKGSANYDQEVKYINKFDKYLFASDKLQTVFKNKPSAVIYGAYEIVCDERVDNSCDNTIKLVYAGSIDKVKGGAFNAIKSMKHLPSNYHLHILGFGEKDYIEEMHNRIFMINKEMGRVCCSYHGALVGNEYKKFLLNCDIGLNPQAQGEYMNSAFPSKVLSYLSHRLKVVSTNIDSIRMSKVACQICFAESDTPESIAEAILKVELDTDLNQISVIKTLDEEFVKDLNSLLEIS